MPPMPLEVKLLTLGIIVLLAGLIAAYHVWLDRRVRVQETASASRPSPARPDPHTFTPPSATGVAPRTPRRGARARGSSLRRVR